jgi:hypothetical protein
MLTRIVHNSPKICAFFDSLNLDLSKPQRQHMLNLMDALLVCEDTKTLAALQRQFIEAPDVSNVADYLRISPWQAAAGRAAIRASQVSWVVAQAERRNLPKVLYINLDDSLEPVDWFHDHTESTRTRPVFKNALCYLEATLGIGTLVVTVDLRLYLRAKTVRRLNRHRSPGQRIPFRSKNSLARAILEDLRPWLPKGWAICVQFDSWYASEQLINYVHRQGWQVTCGLKHNRQLNGTRIDQIASALRHKRYIQIRVTAADGKKRRFYVRQTSGRLENIPFEVRVFFSKRHPREKSPAYFMSTDLTRSAQAALQGYSGRWSCETVNFYLKSQLGLADFRVQSYEAVDKYLVVVLLTWAYVERRFVLECSPQIKTYGDLIRRHRDEHAVDWLTGALEMLQETGDLQQVLQRYLRLDTITV